MSVEEKKAQKRIAEEKKAKAKKTHHEPKMGEPHIAPPVSSIQETGPIVPNETTIPVMEK